MTVIDTSAAEGHTRMTDDLVAASEAHRVGADEEIDGVSAPSTWDGVMAARHGVRRVVAQLDGAHLAAVERLRYRTQGAALVLPRRGARGVTRMLGVDPCLQRGADLLEGLPTRHWDQVLPAYVPTSTLYAALVVPFARPAEASLERVMSHHRGEAWTHDTWRADEIGRASCRERV